MTTSTSAVTERERLLLMALAEGATLADIAGREGTSLARLRREVRALRLALGATNCLNAVVIAVRRGII